MPPDPPRHLVLVGMMGAGKTTVGRRIAKKLGWRFVDVDRHIERRTGRSIPQIFDESGEAEFREIERDAVSALCRNRNASVISTGGGVVLSPANRETMRRHSTVVWLRASPETILRRVRGGEGRPILASDPKGTVLRLCEERGPLYRVASHLVVDVDDHDADEVASRVVAAVFPERQAS